MGAKYQPLADHLAAVPADDVSVEMTFEEVSRLVGGLPPSARTMRTWWGNSSHSQSLAWRSAGWHVAAVEMALRRVRFDRGRVGGSRSDRLSDAKSSAALDSSARPTPQPAGRGSASSSTDGAAEPLETVSVAVSFTWRRLGRVVLDVSGKIRFPAALPTTPGLYRMFFTGTHQDRWYIGETDNLRRRLASNYRNPGPRQQTSRRVNAALLRHLGDGGEVLVDIATEAAVQGAGGGAAPLDLTRKASRLLAESAALVISQRARHNLENLG